MPFGSVTPLPSVAFHDDVIPVSSTVFGVCANIWVVAVQIGQCGPIEEARASFASMGRLREADPSLPPGSGSAVI